MRSGNVIATVVLLGCMTAGPTTQAGVLYSNGPADGNTDAWNISPGSKVADSFTLGGASTITGADFLVWLFHSDTLTTVDWAILGDEPIGLLGLTGGTVFASGTATVTNGPAYNQTSYAPEKSCLNNSCYDLRNETIAWSPIVLDAGTYWFEVTNGWSSTVSLGGSPDPVYWDMNGGPSMAWALDQGDVTDCSGPFPYYVPAAGQGGTPNRCSGTFDITGTPNSTVPEPSTWALCGFGIVGIAGVRSLRARLAAA